MAFTLGQMLGGWRKKGGSKKAPHREGESHPHRVVPPGKKSHSSKSDFGSEKKPDFIPSDFKEEAASRTPKAAIKGESNLAWELITAPHISEKATMLGDNKYIFKVSNKATKGTLKRAIEERYKVDVESLNVLNMPGKKRRRGNMIGLKSGFKKAIVALKTGQTISEF